VLEIFVTKFFYWVWDILVPDLGEIGHVHCCISSCSFSLCFWIDVLLVGGEMNVVFILLSGMQRSNNPSSHFSNWIVQYETKCTFISFWSTAPFPVLHVCLCLCVWYSILESVENDFSDYLLPCFINCRDLYEIFLCYSSMFMSVSCSLIQFPSCLPSKMFVAGHCRVLVTKFGLLCKLFCYLQVVIRMAAEWDIAEW
jgi:hypothetical protein